MALVLRVHNQKVKGLKWKEPDSKMELLEYSSHVLHVSSSKERDWTRREERNVTFVTHRIRVHKNPTFAFSNFKY